MEASTIGIFFWDSLDEMEFLEASASLWVVLNAAQSSFQVCIMQSYDCGNDFLKTATILCDLVFSYTVTDMELLETIASTW